MGYLFGKADAVRLPLGDQSVELVLGSPPYLDCRTYDDGTLPSGYTVSRGCREWVDWMLLVTAEALRVSKGAVVWIASGATRDRTYLPACEGLKWRWWSEGWGERGPGTYDFGSSYRPCYWHRSGIPGSGQDQWFRSDVEYVMCFKRPGPLPWSDNTAMGHVPKHKPGGVPSHRLPDGTRASLKKRMENGAPLIKVTRRNQGTDQRQEDEFYVPPERANPGNLVFTPESYGPTITRFRPGMHTQTNDYVPPDTANPGNVIRTSGGHLGCDLAHDNEAPFPESLAEFFIRSLCPPGGTVLDCFSGSGTTVAVAEMFERHGIGFDLRSSQCELGYRRVPVSLRPVSPLDPKPTKKSLPGQRTFFS